MARVWAEIDLQAVAANTRRVLSRIGSHVQCMAVVKADAYGQGAEAYARTVLAAGAQRLAVASVVEGCQLRRQRIGAPVHILGAALTEELGLAIANGLSISVSSKHEIEEIDAAARGIGRRAVVHLNVDTGMGRLGFSPEAAFGAAQILDRLESVDFEGVSTHFHAAGEANGEVVRQQFAQFTAVRDRIEAAGIEVPLYHAGASAAIELHPGTWLDMVRPGILLHGVRSWTAPEVGGLELLPALQLKTSVVAVRKLPKGHNVGYGVSCSLTRESFVATLSAGYADGAPRSLSNKGQVLISGERCPILGTVCMDYMMVDVTALSEIGKLPTRGDEAVLMGEQGLARISVEEVALTAGTCAHDVLCRLGDRVKQRYKPMTQAASAAGSDTSAGSSAPVAPAARWQQTSNRHRRTA
ncbi:MAG TPA: alanine racemase [Planctomycetota bacterium]|nr:alanine racemase [Planctomycetota bacterium]